MPRPSREAVMSALFSTLVESVQTEFTATTSAGNPVLSAPTVMSTPWSADSTSPTADSTGATVDYGASAVSGLFVGLPVFGGSIPRGSVITNLSPLTLSLAPTANGSEIELITGFLTTGRRLLYWNQVAAQPALFLRSTDEELEYVQTILQRQTIAAEVWIYANAGQNPDAVPETALNNLLDAIQAAFAPDDYTTRRFTLGGLVEWCRLEGRIDKEPGDSSGQAIAVANVVITVP